VRRRSFQFEKQWLDNSDEKIILIDNNNNQIHQTPILKDSSNNKETWQYCNQDFIFIESTKNKENKCDEEPENIDNEETEPLEEESEPLVEKDESDEEYTEESSTSNQETQKPISQNSKPIATNNPIQLSTSKTYNTQSEDIKTQNNILYQSKNELIKKYSVFGFAILCAVLCILLALKKLN
jgi:hypothetical protein